MNAEQILIQLAHFVADNKKAAKKLKNRGKHDSMIDVSDELVAIVNSADSSKSYYTACYDSMIAMSVELVGIADSIDSSGEFGKKIRRILES